MTFRTIRLRCPSLTKALSLSGVTLSGVILCTQSAFGRPIDFNRDIRPILSDNCYYCHGPDEENNKGDLRLDRRDDAIEMGAIVPGDVEKSELIYRIITDDSDDLMPPEKSHKTLSKEEIQLLTQWVKDGAKYDQHWSYTRVEHPGENKSIDALIQEGLAAKGLKPSPLAAPETLIRRLYLDTLGLPPTPEQTEAFLGSDMDLAYEKLVDDLLMSPHFGENMASYWLDAVRFADSVGYHGDQPRDASPFRDYVIHAFNNNKPYDQFITEQLAGDLLPDATMAQRVASGYNRLNQISQEGGIQDKEYIKKYQAERVRTTTTSFLGSTLACAECHDHKYDPFTIKDFYSFAAFFADILEKGAWNGSGKYQDENTGPYFKDQTAFIDGGLGPTLRVPNSTFIEVTAQHHEELEKRKTLLEAGTAMASKEFDQWVGGKKQQWENGFRDRLALAEINRETLNVTVPDSKGKLQKITDLVFESYRHEAQDPKKIGFGIKLVFEKAEYVFTWGGLAVETKTGRITTSRGNPHALHQWQQYKVPTPLLKGHKNGQLLSIEVLSAPGADTLPAYEFRNVYLQTKLFNHRESKLSSTEKDLLQKHLEGTQTPEDTAALRKDFFVKYAQSADILPIRVSHNTLSDYMFGTRNSPATVSASIREVKVLPRGNWMDESGEPVYPATPQFLDFSVQTSDPGKPLTRLDLAGWMTHRDNPLTARTYMNRLWAQFFGMPLSSAPEDLGLQGEYPVYPKLLDYLSAEFMESGWNVRHMVKLILMSQTYRQKSESSTHLNEIDPYNRLLARQSPRRLKAEGIRDNALALSGLLIPRIGGRSVKPYQPEGYYQHLNFPRRVYSADTGENQYRRGVYTHWQRTFLHPMMMAFDAPGRDECAVSRPQSNTPLQALNLLNDPSFVEASIALGKKLSDSQATTDEERLALAFQRVLSRQPKPEENTALLQFLQRERQRYQDSPEDASAYVAAYAAASPTPAEAPELAAWSSLSRALLNLHETITRY